MLRKDEVLVPEAQQGDKHSLDELLRRYKPMVKIKARVRAPRGLEHDDILQEGMIGLFKAVRDYRPGYGASFKVFADMCVERQITTARRAATRKKHTPLNLSVPLDHTEVADDNENMHDHQAVNPLSALIDKEEFKRARGSLTEREADVLSLRLNGRSYQEIASALGVSAKAVDNALQRAKSKLGQG